uniref:Uncharacterized protein n=1 Tax=Panagrolaimus sp. JU765 TaxID=591449 RepID=A0AC34QEW1_9BILA
MKLGSPDLTTDNVLTSDMTETDVFPVKQPGDLYLYYSRTADINVALNNTPISDVSNKITNTPYLLPNAPVGSQYSVSQTNNRFIFIYRVTGGQTNTTNVSTTLTNAAPSVDLNFPETGGIYANNMVYTQSIVFDGVQTISFQFSVFETEDKYDFLTITTPQGNRQTITGPLIDGNGQDYPDSNGGWIRSFAFYNVTSPVQMVFTSNGAIGGIGYKVKVTRGPYVPPSTVMTTPTVPTTTPFVGTTQAANFSSANNPMFFSSVGYPNTLPKGWNKIWQFNPVNTSFWSVFILLDYGTTFWQNTGTQLTVYTGRSTSPQPWDILRSYNFNSIASEPLQALAPAPGQSLSVEFNSGNTSLSDMANVLGVRFLIAMLDTNSINRTASSNSSAPIDRIVANSPINDVTNGYPNYLYPNTTQIYRYFPANDSIQILFYLFNYGSTFDYNNAQLTVYTGNSTDEPNQADILIQYKTRADAQVAVVANPAGKPLSVRFTTTQGLALPGQQLG